MPKNKLIPIIVILGIAFVAFGDSFTFLPKPVRDASVSSRNFVVGLWPKWLRPRDLNEKREQDIEQLNKPGANPSP